MLCYGGIDYADRSPANLMVGLLVVGVAVPFALERVGWLLHLWIVTACCPSHRSVAVVAVFGDTNMRRRAPLEQYHAEGVVQYTQQCHGRRVDDSQFLAAQEACC